MKLRMVDDEAVWREARSRQRWQIIVLSCLGCRAEVMYLDQCSQCSKDVWMEMSRKSGKSSSRLHVIVMSASLSHNTTH